MGGSRWDVFVVTDRYNVRARHRSVSVFWRWTYVDVVVGLGTISRGSMRAVGCGKWSRVRAGHPLRVCFILVLCLV